MGEQIEDARGSRGPRTPRGRVVLGAAAAVMALVGGTVLAVELTAGDRAPAAQADAGATTERVDGAIAPRDGWRWIERGNVAVQVPEEWESVSLTCGGAWDGGAPAVARPGRGDYAVTADCMTLPSRPQLGPDPITDAAFPPVPEELWRTMLIVEDAEVEYDNSRSEPPVPDGTYTHEGWTLRRTNYGDVRVTLLSDEQHAKVASEALGSLVEHDLSPTGCRAIEEFGQERDQVLGPDDEVRAATVCGYTVFSWDEDEQPVHGLQAAARYEGDDASRLVAALAAAPPLASDPDPCGYRIELSYVQLIRLFLADGGVRELEVPVFDCAVQFDGTWRILGDDVESFVARNPGW